MSYFEFNEYNINPTREFDLIRNCSGCGCKMNYINTNNFRVNANGNSIDVWLIYQCDKCKHTYNLPIYERVKPSNIEKEAYKRFLANDKKLAFEYGVNTSLIKKNKAEVNPDNISYEIVGKNNVEKSDDNQIIINNNFGLKVRADKIISEILGISRKSVCKLIDDGEIILQNKTLKKVNVLNIRDKHYEYR